MSLRTKATRQEVTQTGVQGQASCWKRSHASIAPTESRCPPPNRNLPEVLSVSTKVSARSEQAILCPSCRCFTLTLTMCGGRSMTMHATFLPWCSPLDSPAIFFRRDDLRRQDGVNNSNQPSCKLESSRASCQHKQDQKCSANLHQGITARLKHIPSKHKMITPVNYISNSHGS